MDLKALYHKNRHVPSFPLKKRVVFMSTANTRHSTITAYIKTQETTNKSVMSLHSINIITFPWKGPLVWIG